MSMVRSSLLGLVSGGTRGAFAGAYRWRSICGKIDRERIGRHGPFRVWSAALTAGPNPPVSRGVVADDDDATRMLLCRVLTRAAFTVFAVENGELACAEVRRRHPDVILLDWVMPVMDGCRAVAALKSDSSTRAIPIVMLTTHAQTEDRIFALETGVQDFLTKPFDARVLVACIEQQIRWRSTVASDTLAVAASEVS
jgi:CheY-like chemotaxis protein